MNILKFLKPKAVIDYVYDDCTVRQAIEKMRAHGFTAIPVINRQGEYVKTLAEGDFLYFMLDNSIFDIRDLERHSISDIPKRVRSSTVSVTAAVDELVLLAMNQNFVPVTDDRKIFIGIVTRSDILKYCHDHLKDSEQQSG
ncbi:MAG: CBS domain-containing protein [Ruminococcus sp.]|nr:CBS domain-containing protein [Ruminococcus sp.]